MTENIISIVPIEVALDSRLTLRHVRVLIALYSFRGKNTDTVWPTRETLARRCGLPVTRISTVTSDLVELGWVAKDGLGGHSKATRYKLAVPDLETVTKPVTVTEVVTVTKPVTTTVTKPVTGGVTKPVTRKEQTIEHTKEQTKRSPRGARLTISLIPDDWRSFAASARPDLDPDETWERFRDYWIAKPGKDGLKADWFATWRNWVRNENARGRPMNSSRSGSVSDRNRSVLDAWAGDDHSVTGQSTVIEGEFRREAK